jgi:hypothetical protein
LIKNKQEEVAMGWSIGYDSNWNRDIGYGVPAYCDHPGCKAEIDRGLAHVCGGDPYGGEKGCGLYFCEEHLFYHEFRDKEVKQVCHRCDQHKQPYKQTQDHPDWIKWKLTDESWEQWRQENPSEVEKLKLTIKKGDQNERRLHLSDSPDHAVYSTDAGCIL